MSVASSSATPPVRLKPIFKPLLWIVAIVIPLSLWLSEVGNPFAYWQLHTPPGQKFYTLSKLLGLLSVGLMWLQLVSKLGSAVSGLWGYPRHSLKQHRGLGVWIAVALLGHAALFVTAVSVRADHLVLKIMGPNFTVDFFTTAVSLGVVAFYLLILAILAAALYVTARRPILKWLHRLMYVSFILGALHSVLIGSETRSTLALTWYSFLLSSFLALGFFYHLGRSTRQKS